MIRIRCFSILPLFLLTACQPITPQKAVSLMNDAYRPDARREGIAAMVTRWDFGKKPPYPQRYKDFAQHDPDVTVRAMAIRALNICRDASATKIFIDGLTDDSEQIRLESVKALANIPDPAAIPKLINILNGTRLVIDPEGQRDIFAENKDIRIAAADALKQYRGKVDVTRSLVEHLNVADFGVAWQCHQSLIVMTGQDLHYDEAAWLQYLVSKPTG
jgi:hypothetical protein